ncbi:MAG: hypothetical protein M1165_00330 [Candidatus Pacearchaeota archaeon]|nr:hypothetical protein [Candidatus Pacearchaeota archaeon]
MIGGFLDAGILLNQGFQGFLNSLADVGFFSYALPFLLIFSLVFGILMRTGIFKDNKGVVAIIALVVGLMALQFNTVPQFFSQIFPNLGIGLSIILVILIVVGLFTDPKNPAITISLFAVAAIVAVVVIVASSGSDVLTWIQNNLGATGSTLLTIGIIVAVIIAVIVGDKQKEKINYAPIMFEK